jgi:LacI family transcriptional regulator, galactose operon repressor
MPATGRRSRVTIREIAEMAGVSVATVSRVVNGRGYVAEPTREAVQEVVRLHGYSANRSARGLSGGRTGLIGMTVPMIHPSYFAQIVAGTAEALYPQDRRIVLCPTLHQHDREVSLLERLMHGTTEAGVLVLPEETDDELRTLLNHGYRFVVVDPRERLDDEIPTVSAAHSSGADQAMRHLLSLGHRRIGALTGPGDWLATGERLRSYHGALAGAGIASDPQLVVETTFDACAGREAAAALLDLPVPPTAIFAFDDPLAVGVLEAARARGIAVPGELSVVGFDDTAEATLAVPALTTVRQPLAEMGRMAVSLLTRLLDDEPIEALHVELATRLVVRDSTAAAPA